MVHVCDGVARIVSNNILYLYWCDVANTEAETNRQQFVDNIYFQMHVWDWASFNVVFCFNLAW